MPTWLWWILGTSRPSLFTFLSRFLCHLDSTSLSLSFLLIDRISWTFLIAGLSPVIFIYEFLWWILFIIMFFRHVRIFWLWGLGGNLCIVFFRIVRFDVKCSLTGIWLFWNFELALEVLLNIISLTILDSHLFRNSEILQKFGINSRPSALENYISVYFYLYLSQFQP